MDIPNARSSHSVPTPRGGGLAIVLCWFLALVYFFYTNLIAPSLFYALSSGVILAIIGVLDDIYSLSPKLRLLAQAITAFLALYFLNGFTIHMLQPTSVIVTLLVSGIALIGIVWFINLYNFLDGIDGYASLESILVVGAFFLLTGSSIHVVLIAAIVGFLIWNWPKAKIFMGDVGSTQLGFILIVLGIFYHNQTEYSFSFIHWIMLTSVFWFDATYTLYRRWRNKEKLSEAHKKHGYQRVVQAGFSHLKTDMYAVVINLIIVGLVYISKLYTVLLIPVLFINIGLLFFVTKRIDKAFPFSKN